MVFRRLIISGIIGLCLWVNGASAQDESTGFIHTLGRNLVDQKGDVFLIHGIGLGNWLMPEGYMFKFKTAKSPRAISALIEILVGHEDAGKFWEIFRDRYVSREDIQLLKRSGFNTVRVPLHYGLFLGQHDPLGADSDQALTFEGPGWDLLDHLIGWCREAGLRVIIDLHAAPGGQTGINHDDGTGFPLVFYVPRERKRNEALWREIARRYRNDPTVLGYELLNEPISTYNDEDTLNPQLEPLYRELTKAIRKVDSNHIVFLPSPQWGQNVSVFGKPFAPDLVYVFHEFWSTTERDAVQDYVNFSYLYQVPVLLGEAGESNNQWNWDFHRLNERFGFGWSFWTYKNLDSKATVVNITPPKGWDRIVALGSMPYPTLEKAGLSRVEAKEILWSYLDSISLQNAHISRCYIQSLGLGDGPMAPRCTAGVGK